MRLERGGDGLGGSVPEQRVPDCPVADADLRAIKREPEKRGRQVFRVKHSRTERAIRQTFVQ